MIFHIKNIGSYIISYRLRIKYLSYPSIIPIFWGDSFTQPAVFCACSSLFCSFSTFVRRHCFPILRNYRISIKFHTPVQPLNIGNQVVLDVFFNIKFSYEYKLVPLFSPNGSFIRMNHISYWSFSRKTQKSLHGSRFTI